MSAENTRACRRRAPRAFCDDQRGVMIIEVLVSAILLIVMALATLAVIDRSGEASGMNRARSVASALGQKDQDLMRQLPFSKVDSVIPSTTAENTPIAWGGGSGERPVTIDGRTYRVKTTFEIKRDANAITACLAGWQNKRVVVKTVVWPPDGVKMAPVKMQTERVPSITDSATTGSVIVRLSRANGTATSGVPVSVTGATPSSKNTDTDGCAVFNDVPPGSSKTIAWGKAGMVDPNGAQTVSQVLTISAGKTIQLAGRYDTAVAPKIKFVGDDGQTAVWNSASVVNAGVSTVYNGVRKFTSGTGLAAQVSEMTLGGLFPFESAYGVFAGDCWGNNPDVWNGASPADNTFLAPSVTGDVNVLLPRVQFNFPAAGYRAFVAYDRTVYKMGSGRCDIMDGIYPTGSPRTDDERAAPFKQTGSVGNPGNTIVYRLPYGIYKVCVDNPGLNKRLPKAASRRIDNVPDGTPFYTEETSRTQTFAAGDVSGTGTCPANSDDWSTITPANPNP